MWNDIAFLFFFFFKGRRAIQDFQDHLDLQGKLGQKDALQGNEDRAERGGGRLLNQRGSRGKKLTGLVNGFR